MLSNKSKAAIVFGVAVICSPSFAQLSPQQAGGAIGKADPKPTSVAVTATISTPTLGELAEMQRLKQALEKAKIEEEAKKAAKTKLAEEAAAKALANPPKVVKVGKVVKPAPVKPALRNTLHSTYSKSGVWYAEVFDGTALLTHKIGSVFQGNTVTRIDANGISTNTGSVFLGGNF